MRARRAARFICHSDALPRGRVLAYGDRLDFGKFTCVSERVGLTCINAKRFTFFLSRGSYRIYRV